MSTVVHTTHKVLNSRNQGEQGSAITRFLGRGVRGNLPNSLDRDVLWKEQVEKGENLDRKELIRRVDL